MRERSWNFGRRLSRLAAIYKVPAAVILLLCAIALAPAPHRPAYADHNAIYTVCPSPIPEGETAHMRVRWPGKKHIGATIFTVEVGHTASGNDFVPYNGVVHEGRPGQLVLVDPRDHERGLAART